MLYFCPWTGCTLQFEEHPKGNRLICPSCPYVYYLRRPLVSTYTPVLKAVDDVLGGAAAWENAETTEESCPKCRHNKAYFKQVQTRSADEPMTSFYRCCKCGENWKE